MTITPENQPHTPRLHIDIDEILAGTAFAAAHICDECQVPVTILIIDIKRLIEEVARLQAALVGRTPDIGEPAGRYPRRTRRASRRRTRPARLSARRTPRRRRLPVANGGGPE